MGGHLKTKIHIALWSASILMVIAIGLYYFPREFEGAGFWQTLYFTLRLFVFEHDLPRFPQSPPLIFIYFLAPVITLSAAGTAISYLIRFSPALRTRWMSGHVIVCGVGRTGKLFAATLGEKGIGVVGVDLCNGGSLDEWAARHKLPVVRGDFKLRTVLEKAGAPKARAIIFASGNDLVNLEGALSAYEWLRTDTGPARIIWAQIANEQLAQSARSAIQTRGTLGIRFFDTYRIAAERMIAGYFAADRRRGIRLVEIIGFGKFGRDLLDVLVGDLEPGEGFSIEVMDREDRTRSVAALAGELEVRERVRFRQAAIQDLHLKDEPDKAFFICTDDDLGNLTATMALACSATTHIYVRMNHWPLSAVTEHLGEDRGIYFININDLVVQGITSLPGIFEPAKPSDLKRIRLLSCSSPIRRNTA